VTDLVIVRCHCGGRVAVLDDNRADSRASVGILAFRSVQRGEPAPRRRARHSDWVEPTRRGFTEVPFESVYTSPDTVIEAEWTPTCQACDTHYSCGQVLDLVRWAQMRNVRKVTIRDDKRGT